MEKGKNRLGGRGCGKPPSTEVTPTPRMMMIPL